MAYWLYQVQANGLAWSCREDRRLRLGSGRRAGEEVSKGVVQHVAEVHVLGADWIANAVDWRERRLGCIALAEPVRFSSVIESRLARVFRVLFMGQDLHRIAAGVTHIHVVLQQQHEFAERRGVCLGYIG